VNEPLGTARRSVGPTGAADSAQPSSEFAARVLLADDHAVVRQGLKALLEKRGLEVVGEAADGQAAVELAKRLRPDVAVLDIVMPLLNGVEAAHQIARACPEIGVILLTMHTEDHYVLQAIRDGVRGFVIKTQAAEDLFQAIHDVRRGGIYVSPGISAAVLQALQAATGPREPLTHRERQVLQLLVEGKGTKQVAGLLKISVKTAEFHRGRIMKKLDIHETAGLVRYAIRTGLIEP
jgi:DNA-binding NarL/FixJ family response regulator